MVYLTKVPKGLVKFSILKKDQIYHIVNFDPVYKIDLPGNNLRMLLTVAKRLKLRHN